MCVPFKCVMYVHVLLTNASLLLKVIAFIAVSDLPLFLLLAYKERLKDMHKSIFSDQAKKRKQSGFFLAKEDEDK